MGECPAFFGARDMLSFQSPAGSEKKDRNDQPALHKSLNGDAGEKLRIKECDRPA
jgi:hypothetical protein